MKRIVLAIFSAALLFTACSKDDDQQQQAAATQQGSEYVDANGHLVFFAEAGRASKVAMANRLQQCFNAEDRVVILESPSKESLYEVDVDGSTKVSGSSTLYSVAKLVYLSGDELTEGAEHYAVMPSAIWSSGNISVTQTSEQQADAGSQCAIGCIHYAKSSTSAMTFDCLSAMFRLNVVGTNTTCDKIVLSATGIAGNATITIATGAISAGDANEVTFQALAGAKFAADTTYYYGFLPGTYTTLTATAYNGSTVLSTVTYSGKTWASGTVYNIYLKGGKLYKTSASLPVIVDGCLPGEFSVSATTKVKFSQGNLQYQASTGTWRFAESQLTTLGYANSSASSTNSGWIDLFGWGTSGWNSGATCYQPYSTTTTNSCYYPGGSAANNLTGSYANADWGVYNAISNGGNAAGQWRLMTHDEWVYLLNTRADASSKYGQATANGVKGTVLLPDDWTTPSGLTFTAGASGFSTNSYSAADWAKMEAAGAVLLTPSGDRHGTSIYDYNSYGLYWTSTAKDADLAYTFTVSNGSVNCDGGSHRCEGRAVRLVR